MNNVYSVSILPAPRYSCLFVNDSLRDAFLLHRQQSFFLLFFLNRILRVVNYLFTAEFIFRTSCGKRFMLQLDKVT